MEQENCLVVSYGCVYKLRRASFANKPTAIEHRQFIILQQAANLKTALLKKKNRNYENKKKSLRENTTL